MRASIRMSWIFLTILALSGFIFLSADVKAADNMYTQNAQLIDDGKHPGVYKMKAKPGDKVASATLGIPSITKQNLENGPTTESPAIIMGAAVPYEVKTGPTEFTVIPGGELYAPYSYFRYKIIEEANTGGQTGTHRKMSGFDGTYVIVRVDVSDLIKDAPAGSYLHYKVEGNKALMVQLAYDEAENKKPGVTTFSDALGNKVGSYSLDNNAAALKDTTGNDKDTPYVDLILMSSGTLVAGAETGSTDPNVMQADYKVNFYVDQTKDYNPDLVYDPNSTDTNHANNVMAKYYDEKKVSADAITGYVVKGSDLELEVTNEDGARKDKPEFWSLRKAMAWDDYNDSPIKMICEAPVLEGLEVDGTGKTDRKVILDVNSFDIQIANHQETGKAGLTVKNATLTIKDGFNTTGAELAVGNNATMHILTGGKLIIDKTCQLEVEYDAASVAPTEQDPNPEVKKYDCGIISIEDGGEIENNGVITIEGTEGKPKNEQTPTVRDIREAEFHIRQGGKLTNNGCLLSYGSFFNLGTIVNNGRYADTITSNDPDKGQFTYHKGIQISWKDDVTQDKVTMGRLINGQDGDSTNKEAAINNNGDIVLVPGILDNYGVFNNTASGNLYVCPVDEAVIPIQPTVDAPTVLEKRIHFNKTVEGSITNDPEGKVTNAGNISIATVEIVSNGRTGKLTVSDLKESDPDSKLVFQNYGETETSGNISLYGVYSYKKLTNTGKIKTKVVVCKNAEGADITSIVYDKAVKKLTNVYNADKKVEGNTNIWTYTDLPTLTVSPLTQEKNAYEKPVWTLRATFNQDPDAEAQASESQYEIGILQEGSGEAQEVKAIEIPLDKEVEVEGPELPNINGNMLYSFYVYGAEAGVVKATVKVSAVDITAPVAKEALVYNGKDQALTTSGGAGKGILQYRLGADGEWTDQVPTGKDAGTYTVYYKLDSSETEAGSVEVTIAPKPVTLSLDDQASKVGEDLKELTYTVNGLLEGDSIGTITPKTDADKDTVGKYIIDADITEPNANYEVKKNSGFYNVSEDDFQVTAKDKHGVFSDDTATYKGFNIELTAPQGSKIYYSTDTKLDATNYSTKGIDSGTFGLLKAAGTHTVYYYVLSEDGSKSASGSRQVIIEKAQQKAPALTSEKNTKAESIKNAGDGEINGLTPLTMEYRKKDGDGTYKPVNEQKAIKVGAGTYLVRLMADANHYAGEDVELVVAEGKTLTVTFDSKGGSAVEPVTGLTFGERVPKPAEPTYKGHVFDGWCLNETDTDGEFDFTDVIFDDLTLFARWKENEITEAPAATPDMVYNGQDQALTTEGGALQGNLQYKLGDDGSWTDQVPTAKDIGTYKVYYKLADADKEAGSVEVTVNPRPVTISLKNQTGYVGEDLKELTFTYDGLVKGDSVGTVTPKTDADKATVGKYVISADLMDPNPNYKITIKTGIYTIKEPEPEPQPEPEPKPEPSKEVSGILLARMVSKGTNNLTITWTKVQNVDGYEIRLKACGAKKIQFVKTIKGNKTFTYTVKGRKKKKTYVAYVRAFVNKNGKKNFVKKSPAVHAFTTKGNKKYTNPKAVKVNKDTVTLNKGKSTTIKASVTRINKRRKLLNTSHGPTLRYYSTNTKIAKVDNEGKITAVGQGSCKICVLAINGVRKSVKVTVK